MSRMAFLLAFGLFVVGCGDVAPAPSGSSATAPEPSITEPSRPRRPPALPAATPDGPRAPFVATLRALGEPRAGGTLEVELSVTRAAHSQGTLDLDLVLPPGATLLRGKLRDQADDDERRFTRRYLLQLSRLPEDDLSVRVSRSDPSSGAVAVPSYGFGRPEPRFATLQRTESLRVGALRVRAPITLDARALHPR